MTTTMTASNLFEYKQMVYNTDLKSRALSVLIYLVDRADNKAFTCYPSISTIGEKLHISISTVKRAMKELITRGFLKRKARFAESKNGGQTSNLYTLALPQEQPLDEPRSDLYDDGVIACEEVETSCAEPQTATEPTKKHGTKHISFELLKIEKLKKENDDLPPVQKEEVPPVQKQSKGTYKPANKTFLSTLFKRKQHPEVTRVEVDNIPFDLPSMDGTGVHFDTPFNYSD